MTLRLFRREEYNDLCIIFAFDFSPLANIFFFFYCEIISAVARIFSLRCESFFFTKHKMFGRLCSLWLVLWGKPLYSSEYKDILKKEEICRVQIFSCLWTIFSKCFIKRKLVFVRISRKNFHVPIICISTSFSMYMHSFKCTCVQCIVFIFLRAESIVITAKQVLLEPAMGISLFWKCVATLL